jgi:UDPglucose--hexose-1-phosphate uridylyltransferase
MTEGPHRRQNLLTGDWVLVSPHRLQRPWQGAIGAAPVAPHLIHDAECYLCPGNARAEGQRNPPYSGVYVFDNDFPALLGESVAPAPDPLLVAEPETGLCRVVCYAPEHHLTLSRMTSERIAEVVGTWASQYAELAARADIGAVTIFENRGDMMGASNPHPHGQIWATASIPPELEREDSRQRAFFDRHATPLLTAYLDRELQAGTRIVCVNDDFVALVPFWAIWPFETLVLPRRPVADLSALPTSAHLSLARILSSLTARYDALFDRPFPYSMGWHQRPTRERDARHFVLHAHFYPPLLRSAEVRKFMVGFEMLAMPQRDFTPEAAAARLRAAGPSSTPAD